jgi:putative MFS transporter
MRAAEVRLLAFLGVATFFEGFDLLALAQVLPDVRAAFGLSEWETGAVVAIANLGAVLAFLLVRAADRWGRRRVLLVTLVGYAAATAVTGCATSVWTFAAAQLVARFFLLAEWGVAMVYAAESFPASRRGAALGWLQAASSLGGIVCGAAVPILTGGPLGWRAVFFAGLPVLLLLAMARVFLPETPRFAAVERTTAAPLAILRAGYGPRVARLAFLWAATYVCTQSALPFWKEFAVRERGWSDREVALALTVAAVTAAPAIVVSGRLLDALGRRVGATLTLAATAVGVVLAYRAQATWALTLGVVLAVFGSSAVLPALNAWTAELFPTELRGAGAALANNLLGRIGYVVGPLAVGAAAGQVGWGVAVAATALGPLVAMAGVWRWMPETRGQELEVSAALEST